MAETSMPIQTSHCRSKRLLFVDDEEGIRLTIPLLLQARGFDVRVAASVPEALSEIRTHKFDVLLSDLNIGKDGDGFSIVQAIRKHQPNCITCLKTCGVTRSFTTVAIGKDRHARIIIMRPENILH